MVAIEIPVRSARPMILSVAARRGDNARLEHDGRKTEIERDRKRQIDRAQRVELEDILGDDVNATADPATLIGAAAVCDNAAPNV